MPSSPKVQKETILAVAYEMLLKQGYASINIKTVAEKLGCSTQPISRQFGSMDGFRKELLTYCLEQMKQFFEMTSERVSDIVSGIAKTYIGIAFEFPNLYKYLYMKEHEEEKMSMLIETLRSEKHGKIIRMLTEEYQMPEAYAKEYLNNLNFYVHGVASYVAVGFVNYSKQEVMDRVQRVSDALLKNWQEIQIPTEQ